MLGQFLCVPQAKIILIIIITSYTISPPQVSVVAGPVLISVYSGCVDWCNISILWMCGLVYTSIVFYCFLPSLWAMDKPQTWENPAPRVPYIRRRRYVDDLLYQFITPQLTLNKLCIFHNIRSGGCIAGTVHYLI